MKKHEVIQALEELWGKASPPADFREVISTPVVAGQDEDYEELEDLEDDQEKQEVREVIQALEELWGKASLPAGFREVISTSDWQQPSRRNQSGRVISMAEHRRKRELLQSGISLGVVLAACFVLIFSWSLNNAPDNAAVANLETTIKEGQEDLRDALHRLANAPDNTAVASLEATIKGGQEELWDALHRLAWVTKELAQTRIRIASDSSGPEKAREKLLLAGKHFKRASELGTDQTARMAAQYDAALVYEEACDFEEARTLLQEIVDEEGDDRGKAKALFLLGSISQRMGEYDKAISQYDAAIQRAAVEAPGRVERSNEEVEKLQELQESASFNLALVHATLFAKNKDSQHLQDTLKALEKSIQIGRRERLTKILKAQKRSTLPNMFCSDFPWIQDLSTITEEPEFRGFLERHDRWL